MTTRKTLGEFELLVLFALLDCRDEAYGLTVKRSIEERTGRDVTVGAVYTALERLERRGLVSSTVGEPTPKRGGRRKKYYTLEPAGAEALKASYDTVHRMADGLVERLESLVR